MSDTTFAEVDAAAMQERIAAIQSRVDAAARASGRSARDITIVAVSKTFARAAVDTAIELGLTTFGENRVQEAREKFSEPLPVGCAVHLIGHLQSNKARHAAHLFQCIESVDRLSLVDALEREATRLGRALPALIQVNVAREPQKSGCAPDEAERILEAIQHSDHLRCDGLMTIAPMVEDPEDARPTFIALRDLRDRLELSSGASLPVLSMGMTNDYAAAIAEGATHVRLGRAIFGTR